MDWFKNLKVGNKLGLGFGLTLILVTTLSVISYSSINSMIQTSGWVDHTHKVIRVGESLSASMVDMETGLRGFLVTGNEEFLEPYFAGDKQFKTLVQKGAELTSDNPAQVKRWANVADMKKLWLEKWAEPQIAQRKIITQGEKSLANFKQVSARLLGKTLFDGIRVKLATLDAQIPKNNLHEKLLSNQALLALVNMETGQRGFLLSGVEASLEPYIQGEKDLLAAVTELTKYSDAYTKNVNEIRQAVSEWQTRVANVEIDARRDMNKYPVTIENVIADMTKGTGKHYMDLIRAEINNIVAAEESLIVIRNEDQKATATFANNFTMFGTLFVVLLSIVIALLVTRTIVGPIQKMRDVVAHVLKSGDLSSSVDCTSKDEVGESIIAFNQLINYLKKAVDDANRVIADIANGKLDTRIKADYSGDLLMLKKGVNQSAESIESVIKELSRVMESMKNGQFNLSLTAAVKGEFLTMVNNTAETTQSVNASIRAIIEVMNAMQQGQFNQRVLVDAKGDLLTLKNGINTSMDALESAIKDVITIVLAQSKGDLTQQITHHYDGELGVLKKAVNDTTSRLQEVVARAVNAADVVNSASSEVAQGALDLSQRVQEQAAALEETSSTMEEMSSAVKNNSDNAKEASDVAQKVKAKSLEGSRVMQQTIDAMNEIQDSSRKIAEIVTLIDSIAFQTNLLALNAAVEAARAGDHGRGFAVVAGEVRNLAQKSADAAKNITSLINESVSRIDQGTKLASDSGAVLTEINEAVDTVTDMIEHISIASQEQLTGIRQVYTAINQIDTVTQQNAALVEETSAASESLNEQSSTLSSDMAFFKIKKY
ncbi:CHASE3 domain-containing protein [Thiosulfativibrio zosterae]|uniref:Methyl-accepting chemotaxis protein n=1 Tax=Thiosulfativibrio zosterae TaxID=2675053 RepID=A0A6F8PNR6_9GAMM|nr:CHASE3 domain-containing protein [Thiosulfativibrio zosterae]BBP43677.1 hypothetical protein THMIRHAT_14230 [Thiosulfativibrio zosterae]